MSAEALYFAPGRFEASMSRPWGVRCATGAIKRVLNAFLCGVINPFLTYG